MKILSKLIVSNLFIIWLINVKENLELDKIDKIQNSKFKTTFNGLREMQYTLTYKTNVHKCGVL